MFKCCLNIFNYFFNDRKDIKLNPIIKKCIVQKCVNYRYCSLLAGTAAVQPLVQFQRRISVVYFFCPLRQVRV